MAHRKMSANEFLVGAAVGSLLGGVSALLMAPKTGKRLRQDINDVYCDMTERTSDAAEQVSKKGKALAKSMSCQSHDLADKAKCMLCGVKNFLGYASEDEEDSDEHLRDLLIGGAVGGILGAVTGLLLARKPGNELREDLADTYEDVAERTQEMAEQMSKKGKTFVKTAKSRANNWINVAKEIVDGLTDEVEEKGSELKEQAKSRFNDVADWASLGFRVWNEISKRK
jgi:gas vesicle protein